MEITEFFKLHKNVAIAVSGGVDSAVLLLLAKKHAQNVKAYFVKTPFQPRFERDDAIGMASLIGTDCEIIELDVLDDSTIASNPADRCYHCKKKIFTAICNAATRDGFNAVCDGTNASDDIEDRAGFRALQELGVLSPLRECGYTKAQIRSFAGANNLPVAGKPSYACLATRIPAGTAITADILNKTESAENALMDMGFGNLRVRYDDGAAKLELGADEIKLLEKNREKVFTILSEYYDYVYPEVKERAYE